MKRHIQTEFEVQTMNALVTKANPKGTGKSQSYKKNKNKKTKIITSYLR